MSVTKSPIHIKIILKIYQMRVEGSDRHRQKAFKKIILSLGFEIFLSIGTILSIIADVMEYNGTRFYHFDYFLIAWSLAAMTEQKKLYQIIFGKEEASSSAYTNQTKHTATKSIVNGVNVFDQGAQKSNGNAVFV
ncbi:hypothetical protein HDV02_004653 [Globomyces sp. JEL0801]|nr:hypothetical protein HDV02_004653 [Globomyces sp. JEL0801]